MQHQTSIKLLSLAIVAVMAIACATVLSSDEHSEAATNLGILYVSSGENDSNSSALYSGVSGTAEDYVENYSGDTIYVSEGARVTINTLGVSPDYWSLPRTTMESWGLTFYDDSEGDYYTGTLTRTGTLSLFIAGEDDSYTVNIVVVEDSTPVTSVSISGSTSGEVGDTITLTATTSPSSADDRHVTWSITSGSSRASIDSTSNTTTGGRAVIYLESAGTVTVRATATDGSGEYDTHTITITEPEVLVTSVSISGSTSMEVGDTITLTATTSPSNADDRTVYWQVTSGSSRVSISESDTSTGGKCTVEALSAGTVTIRAYANDGSGEYDTHTITITEPEVLVTSVTITGSSNVAVGSSIILTATTSPTDADDRHVTWSITSGSSYVTYEVSSTSTGGTITLTGVSPGTVTVEAEAADGSGASDTFTISVYTPDIEISTVQNDVTIITGQEFSTIIQTNVSGCTIDVTGADWLEVSGSTVSGTPTSSGSYDVTITASHDGYNSDTISFTITVVSALGFTNEPSNGVTVYVVS